MYQMIIYLVLLLPAGSSNLPKARRAAVSLLFGLASDGVYICHFCYQKCGELLPRRFTLTYKGGYFLLHLPGSRLHRTLSGILPCEARTFLTCCLSAIAAAIICATQSFLVCIFFYHTEYINTELSFFAKSYKTAAILRAVFVL